jgi:hypothetical protein
MSEVVVLRNQLHHFHEYLEVTMEGVTDEHAHWVPPGAANPIGAIYAHVIFNEDDAIQRILQGRQPLAETVWVGRSGANGGVPLGVTDWADWARRTRFEVRRLREFAKAVYAATDDYLAIWSESDMVRQVDLSRDGFGIQPAIFVPHVLLANVAIHTGEIACLKGIQGLRGLPN